MNLWKKIGVIGLSVLFILPFAGCKKENEELKYLNYGRLNAPLMLVDFDHQTVETQNVYATIYFGPYFEGTNLCDKMDADSEFYAQAFFTTAKGDNVYKNYIYGVAMPRIEEIRTIDALHAGKVTDELFRGKTYIVHAENDYLPYLAGEYDVERIHKLPIGNGGDWDEDLYFHHSQRVHIPSGFFTEPSGTLLFFYYVLYLGEEYICSETNNIKIEYELTDKTVTVKKKTMICENLSGHPITNLDGKIFRRS